ncbi:hypothetical protein QO002_004363 [Pararhizobium capsulatum DSM 1112]|uniref:Uncharacterized protein n=1 Tax=Pararhizobium capsulatum DSM 1112 TaxID=1121113 RepID=A0ABU0BW30_9HYPH|nr:hypothetical protein [Pararhizobium capsulatum]MDQ0322157.1 hypothetical protein [Pararhizobium capsulatum DSM 1112]
MADTRSEPLATSLNGVVTPLYFDRQVVRADDLTLDRSSHDAELARMRRMLHGWGIVTGFALVNTDSERQAVTVTPGYGITPNGNEVFLTEAIELSGLAEVLAVCCGPGMPGCEIVDENARRRAEETAANGTVEGWLVARPYLKDGELRPGVPEGCEHPANALLPSRRCEGVTFDIVCGLKFPHVQDAPSCEYLSNWICRPPAEGREPLPLPMPVEACEDYLVIGRITINDGVFRQTYENRRPLFPVSLLQDWMMACLCGVRTSPMPIPTPVPVPIPTPVPIPDPPIIMEPPIITGAFVPEFPEIPITPFPIPPVLIPIPPVPEIPILEDPTWGMFNERAVANGLNPIDAHVASNQEKLTAVGIDRPGKLLSADLDQVALATGLTKTTLEVMRNDLQGKRFLLNAPHI